MRIRAATLDDAEAIARNHQAAWQVGYRGIIADDLLDGLDLGARIERWRTTIEANDPGDAVLVAEDDGELRGHVSVGPATRHEDEGGELISLYVAPEGWGRGYGRALLVAGRAAMAEIGYDSIWLWVLDGNTRAQALYESDGWVLDGRREPSIIGGVDFGVDELRMRWIG
jgi:ribosomal protein S18 acetylase RimI-like enzyme